MDIRKVLFYQMRLRDNRVQLYKGSSSQQQPHKPGCKTKGKNQNKHTTQKEKWHTAKEHNVNDAQEASYNNSYTAGNANTRLTSWLLFSCSHKRKNQKQLHQIKLGGSPGYRRYGNMPKARRLPTHTADASTRYWQSTAEQAGENQL